MRVPPALQPGHRILVVAPSGPFDDTVLRAGLARLSDFDVVVPEGLWGRRSGFLAGDDDARLAELQAALDADEASAVWVARGGYGLARLLPKLSYELLLQRPKWVVGFSDTTALHCALSARGLASLHACNATTLARTSTEDFNTLRSILAGDLDQRIEGLSVWAEGRAQGPLFGGNLTVMFAEAAAGRLAVPPGAVLLLEDITETSYRIDRMLSALAAGGHFAEVTAFVVGEFVDCSDGKFGVSASDVLREHLSSRGVPVLAEAPFGHGPKNRPWAVGARATLDTAERTLITTSP